MTEKYGTNISGLTAFEGDVSTDSGASLIDTDSDGESALLFGPAAVREILAGIANGDFALPPDDADSNLSDENPLPYWTFTDNSSGGITAAVVADASNGSGNVLRFTVNTTNGNNVQLTRYIPIPGSRNREFVFNPEFTAVNATSTANAFVKISFQYYKEDQTTTTGTGDNASATFSAISSVKTVAIGTANATRLAAPADAGWMLVTLEIGATGTVSAKTVDIAELRLVTGSSDLYIAENTAPATYGPARLRQTNGVLSITPNLGGAGTVTVDGTLSMSNLSLSGTLDVAGVTSLTNQINVTRAAADNDAFLTKVTGDTFNRFLIEADGGMFWGSGSAARDVNLYRSSSTTLRTDDAFAADSLSATLSVNAGNGNFNADGPSSSTAIPTTSGRGAVWTSIGGAEYRLERYVAASTREVKKHIAATTVAPEQFYALQLVDFEYDQEKIEALRETYPSLPDAVPGGIHRGVVWEQVVEALPHAAIPANAGDPPSIDWEALYFAALVAIQDLNQRVAALEAE
jgi:hypothetical protein